MAQLPNLFSFTFPPTPFILSLIPRGMHISISLSLYPGSCSRDFLRGITQALLWRHQSTIVRVLVVVVVAPSASERGGDCTNRSRSGHQQRESPLFDIIRRIGLILNET